MPKLNLLSWNVNGIRAVLRKNFGEWLNHAKPDLLAIQETKAEYNVVKDSLSDFDGYNIFWNAARRKGYSGVATFSRQEPMSTQYGFGIEHFDNEGRVIVSEFDAFTLLNIYFPNGKRDQERLDYKMDFYEATLDYCERLRESGKELVVCGDFNTAHTEIDLKNPKANSDVSGFLPIEREWIDRFIDHGYVDTFRYFHPNEPDHYSWWTYRFNARARNIGWRIDYFFVSKNLLDAVTDAFILKDVMGSDHCPVGLKLSI